MVRKYCIQQAGLLCLVAVIMILTNMIGYQMPLADSIAGILVLCAIALFGLTVSRFMSRFIKLPSMMYVSLTGLLLACPVSPVKDVIIQVTSQVAFMAPATALGAFAGISLGKDLKNFALEDGCDYIACDNRNLYILCLRGRSGAAGHGSNLSRTAGQRGVKP